MSVSFRALVGAYRGSVAGVGLVGLDVGDRDQRQADVADLLEQAVQRGLVGDRAVDDGGAVALVAEAQAVEPGSPAGIEVPLEADLVASGLVAIAVDRVVPLIRSFPPALRSRLPA